METKHTPGEWRYFTGLSPSENHNGYMIVIGGKNAFIGEVYPIDTNGVEGEANAKLIAAAPDLLAALNDITEMYVSLINSGDCGNWDPETENEVISARSAIKKATA